MLESLVTPLYITMMHTHIHILILDWIISYKDWQSDACPKVKCMNSRLGTLRPKCCGNAKLCLFMLSHYEYLCIDFFENFRYTRTRALKLRSIARYSNFSFFFFVSFFIWMQKCLSIRTNLSTCIVDLNLRLTK